MWEERQRRLDEEADRLLALHEREADAKWKEEYWEQYKAVNLQRFGSAGGAGPGPSSAAAAGGAGPGPGSLAGVGVDYSLYKPVTHAVSISFIIMGARRNDRSMLTERMEAHGIRGTVRRVSTQEVKCVAVVALHEAGSLDMFMKDVFKVAPLLNSVDKDKTHSVLAVSNPEGPMVSQDAKMLQLLAKPVTVYQVATAVRNACVDDPSRISDDPDGAESTVSSLPSSERYGP